MARQTPTANLGKVSSMNHERRSVLLGCLSMLLLAPLPAFAGPKGGMPKPAAQSRPSTRSMTTARSMISQSQKTNGHLTRYHIGRPASYLKTRANTPILREAFKTAAARPGSKVAKPGSKTNFKRKEVSSFKNEKAAQVALARAIEGNREALRSMMVNKHTRKTITTAVPKSAGQVWVSGSNRFQPPARAIFSIQRVGNRLICKTGYLTTEGSKNV